jgi:hypothetical protein
MSERGRLLKTDFTEVDSRLAESIKQRKYRKVSAEV